MLPWGISSGFLTFTLPSVLTSPTSGFSVETSGYIVAAGLSANLVRFLWGPMVDLTLTLRRWYAIILVVCSATLLLLAFAPLHSDDTGIKILAAVALLSQVAATMISVPVGGLMAHTVDKHEKDRAAGYFQGGILAGQSLGGAGVWLAANSSISLTGAVLSAVMMSCAGALYFVPDVSSQPTRWGHQMSDIGRDFLDMLRSPIILLAIFLFASPVGIGAATNHWTAIAEDWGAQTNWVTLFIILSNLAGAVGCLIGGWFADNVGRWWA